MISNVFEDWLGEAMAEKLARAKFEPAGAMGSSLFVSHKFSQSVLLTNEEFNPTERSKLIQHYLHFFEEIIEKLQVQAMELVPNIDIPPTQTEEISRFLRMFLEKILRGFSAYRPYLMNFVPTTADELERGVNLILHMALPDTNSVSNRPELYWLVKTEFWQRDKAQLEAFRKIDNIETSSDYPMGPLDF